MTRRRLSVAWHLPVLAALSLLAACGRDAPPQADSKQRESGAGSSAAGATQPSPSASSSPPAGSRPLQPQRSYADPLPAALELTGPPDYQAAQLARRVANGGTEGLPAFIAALRASGIAVQDQSGRSVVTPAQPAQGWMFRPWEINALGEMVLRHQQPVQTLSGFAELVAGSSEGIDAQRVAELLLQDLREHAQGAHGPKRFWARFIVELGRKSQFGGYDLLNTDDVEAIQLDSIQMALITKRLAADLAHRTRTESAAPIGESAAWLLDILIPRAHAQPSPCTFEGPDGEVMDWHAIATGYGFGHLLGYLEGAGMASAGRLATLTGIGNVVLAYAKLIYTHAAFEVEFELEGGQPLVRTQKQNPRSGEVRTLVATVSMNSKDDQWVNCLRPVLNAMGLDFNTDGDGPMKGVSITWSGMAGFDQRMAAGGGPDYVVRYVTDDSQRIQTGGGVGPGHAIMDNRTDDQGKARVNVEGVGQEEDLGPDPEPVIKPAIAVVKVVLKPADLFRDMKDAVGTASGGLTAVLSMPAELLYRTRWSFGASYMFDVKDWRMKAPAWIGTITYSRQEKKKIENVNDSHCCGGKPTRHTMTQETNEVSNQTWKLTGSEEPIFADENQYNVPTDYEMHFGGWEVRDSYRNGYNSCGRHGGSPTTFTKTHEEKTNNMTFAGTASVSVNIDRRNGSYSIELAAPEQEMEGDYTWLQVTEFGPGCADNQRKPVRRNAAKSYKQGTWTPGIEGKLDPNKPDELSGTQAETKEQRDGSVLSEHVTWELRRVAGNE